MKKKEEKKTSAGRQCQKCHEAIGGKAYYVIQLDCIYDGESLSACDRLVLCSECYHQLRSWLEISP